MNAAMMVWTLLHFLLAGVSASSGLKGSSIVSPPVKQSDKKFFGKDYPWDKRPAVDVLHFNHPYPVVQDSDDFDKDFVKDENSDNGEYKAQTEYDRLRHKLAKEKAQVGKALKATKHAEDELHDAIRREEAAKEAEKKRVEAMKKAQKEKEETEAQEKKRPGGSSGADDKKEEKKETEEKTKAVIVPGSKSAGGVSSPGDVDVASGDTEKAMDKLDECKKQLEKAREKLKTMTKELEGAKKQQQETQAALDADNEVLKKAEAKQTAAEKAAEKEYQEYIKSKESYEKQQALVAKMEVDIKAAAAKVKAHRDAADKDGGVYPTPRSGASPRSVAPLLTLALVALTVSTLVQ